MSRGADRPGEFELIARLFAPLARGEDGAFGLLDDAAALAPTPGRRLVATADAIVAGVHFLSDTPADLVARKLLRVNLSDLAAMGATGRWYLVTVALPWDLGMDWLEGFAAGLAADQDTFGIVMVGGDTVSTSGPLTLSLTALGEAEPERVLRRAGARSGDRVLVSGTIGDAGLGLGVLKGEIDGLDAADAEALAARHRLPEPRTGLGPVLGGIASACIDVSDGLMADLGHICEASRVGARIDAAQVPLSPAARRAVKRLSGGTARALTGGDDYELLFTVAPDRLAAAHDAARAAAVPVAEIGQVVEGRGAVAFDDDGQPLELALAGFSHF